MKFEEIKIGTIFNLDDTPSYPKLKIDGGYVDMRDGIVNTNPNPAVLSAKITLMNEDDLTNQFNKGGFSIEDIKEWVKDLRDRFTK